MYYLVPILICKTYETTAKDLWTSKINGQQKMSMCQLQGPIDIKYINIYTNRHPVGSFDQAYQSCFHIKIS